MSPSQEENKRYTHFSLFQSPKFRIWPLNHLIVAIDLVRKNNNRYYILTLWLVALTLFKIILGDHIFFHSFFLSLILSLSIGKLKPSSLLFPSFSLFKGIVKMLSSLPLIPTIKFFNRYSISL